MIDLFVLTQHANVHFNSLHAAHQLTKVGIWRWTMILTDVLQSQFCQANATESA